MEMYEPSSFMSDVGAGYDRENNWVGPMSHYHKYDLMLTASMSCGYCTTECESTCYPVIVLSDVVYVFLYFFMLKCFDVLILKNIYI